MSKTLSSQGLLVSPSQHIECVLERIVAQHAVLAPDYKDFIQCLHALATEFGEGGREYAHRAFQFYPKYKPSELDKSYDDVLNGNRQEVNIGTFYYHCKQAGVDVSVDIEKVAVEKKKPGRPKKQKDERTNEVEGCIKFLTERYLFRFNLLLESIELAQKNAVGNAEGSWKRMDDRVFNTLFTQVKKEGIHVTQNNMMAFIGSEDFAPSFNPIHDYLERLNEWDQVTDYIKQLFDHFTFDSEETRRFCMPLLKKWFICMVALWLRKVDDNQIMPVLVGEPHVGKSYFCYNLLPPEMRSLFHTIYPGEKIQKDQLISMSEFALITFEEFRINCAMVNIMKALVTSKGTEQRRAFGHYAINRQRKASFIGNCNDEKYIANADGDRRYLSVKVVGSRDMEQHPLPYEGAYAQAYWIVMHKSPKEYQPTREESYAIHDFNKEFVMPNTCITLLSNYYRKPDLNEQGELVSMADIISQLAWLKDRQVTELNIAKALVEMGIEKKHTARGNRYLVVKLNMEEEVAFNRMEAQRLFNERKQSAAQACSQQSNDVLNAQPSTDEPLIPF